MAIPSTTDFESKGSLGEIEDIEMTIDEDGMQFLMSILTNLYEDPVLAVVREYSTNAADAHIEAGYDGPVEVTLPTQFQKNFIVRDYGPGMDLDDIRNTYSKYVASTKRQSNTQAGMFGIGAKSALALGDTFTVVSIKEGRKIEVAVLRKGRGKASMKIVANNVETDEPNGTIIKVPARFPHEFNRASQKFYKYVKQGVFEVDGKDLGETFEGIKVDDDTYALPQDYYDTTSYIVMGNVPYPVSINDKRGVVKYVEPGTFEPIPSREGLEQTTGFKERINKYLEEAAKGIADSFTEEIKDMEPAEAAEHLKKNISMLQSWRAFNKVSYDGKTMDSDFKLTGCVRIVGSSTPAPEDTITFGHYLVGAHVVGFDGKKKSDVNDYACKKTWGVRSTTGYPDAVFLHFSGNKPKYAAPSMTVEWDKAKRTNTWGGYSRRYGSNVAKAGDDWKVPTKKAYYNSEKTPTFPKGATKVVPFDDWKGDKDDRELVYFSPTELNTKARVDLFNALMDDKDVFVVIKYTNQHDKTKRDTPEAKHITEVGKDMAKKLVDKYGEGAFINIHLPSKWKNLNGELFDKARDYQSKVKDPKDLTGSQKSMVRSFGVEFLTIEAEYDKLVDKISARYPLLSAVSWSADTKDLNEYVKAMDAYKDEKETA